MKQIHVSENVQMIGERAFENCIELKAVVFAPGASLNRIESEAFKNCSAIEMLNLPKSVSFIGDHAFTECRLLKEVTFEDGCKLT